MNYFDGQYVIINAMCNMRYENEWENVAKSQKSYNIIIYNTFNRNVLQYKPF